MTQPKTSSSNAAEVTDLSNVEPVRTALTAVKDAEVLLGTARIKILDKFNDEHNCRVLLDGGSQSHFITERLAEKLRLPKTPVNLPFAGLSQVLNILLEQKLNKSNTIYI